MVLQVGRQALNVFEAICYEDYQRIMQQRSWANIPILNEWKRRYSKRDPVEFHQALWQTRLSCPGGGRYVWSEQFQTMQSTVYGHPGKPKPGPKLPSALRRIESANFGVTFEHGGLRAKVAIERTAR